MGFTRADESRFGVDPAPYLPILTQVQIQQHKAEFKAKSLGLKRMMLGTIPNARKYIPVDSEGEPIYNEEVDGEYAVRVFKISKGDGVTEYGLVE